MENVTFMIKNFKNKVLSINVLLFCSVLLSFTLSLLLLAPDVRAADGVQGVARTVSDDISLRIGGTIQPRMTLASDDDTDRYGFGLRRMRMRLYTGIGDNLGIFLQMEGSGASATWLDVRGEYKVSPDLTIRAGRFVGAQPRAFARTSHSHIDAIDRPAISDLWARMTLGADGRDYGVEALWNTPGMELRAFVHNGYNQSNYRLGIGSPSPTAQVDTDGLAISGAATLWPSGRDQLELGLYGSINTAKNPNTNLAGVGRNYISYSAQAYWGPLPGDQPVRAKLDIIGISYQEVKPLGQYNYLGASLFGGYLAMDHLELFAMGELWFNDGGDQDALSQVYGTLGGSWSLSALKGRPFVLNRIIVAYSLRTQPATSLSFDDPAHVLMIQSQFYF